MPWMREDLGEETDHSMKEISEEEALFLSKLQMIGISFELSLAILSEMRRTGGDIPKEKYESWGFADAFSMGYVELQYQLTQEGMTVEQVDYLESNASLLAALDLALYNIAAAGIKIAGSGVLSEKFNKLVGIKETTKKYSGKAYSGNRNSNIDFRNTKGKSTLNDHFYKHGSGYASPEIYKNAANNFLEKLPTATTQSFVSTDGTYFRYDTATNEFGIINKYGGISTYFKPNDGLNYWLDQINKYAPK